MYNQTVIINPDQKIESILRICAQIFKRMGYNGPSTDYLQEGRQIVFDNQIIQENNALSLTVVVLNNNGSLNSQTFNFEYRNLPGKKSSIKVQNMEVQHIVVQLIEAEKYRQLSLHVYFVVPINYASEDLVFRVKVEDSAVGKSLKLGFPWLDPKLHMSQEAVLETINQIYSLFPRNAV